MKKIIKTLNSILMDTNKNSTEAARRLGVNRGALSKQVSNGINAYIVDEEGYVYKRTGKKYQE